MISAKRSAYLTANRSEFLSAGHSLLPAAHLAVADAGISRPVVNDLYESGARPER